MTVPAAHPQRHVPIARPGGPRQAWAVELAAPLALGQRGLVVGPPRSGCTTVLRWLGSALASVIGEGSTFVVLVDCDVEEQLEWREALPGATFAVTSSDVDDPSEHRRLTSVFEAARREADDGHDVAVLVDSFSSLARACIATSDPSDERVLDGGIPQLVLRELRQWFAMAVARSDDVAGTLTILGTVRSDSAMQLDEVLLHEFVGTGNVEWHLDAAVQQAGCFPPVDVLASGARRSELILGEREADRRALLRAEVDRHGPAAGLGLLELQLDELGSLDAVLDAISGRRGDDA